MNVIHFDSDPAEIWGLYGHIAGIRAFDVGANGGMVSRLLAPHFDSVFAFEPCSGSYEHLVAADLPGNVACIPFALSDRNGTISLRVAEKAIALGELVTGTTLAASWGNDVGARTVEAMTLDHACSLFGEPDLVKIDTEGHEAFIVRGGQGLFAGSHPRLLIEIHAQLNADAIVDMLPFYEFRTVRHPSYPRDSWEWDNHFWMVSEDVR